VLRDAVPDFAGAARFLSKNLVGSLNNEMAAPRCRSSSRLEALVTPWRKVGSLSSSSATMSNTC